MVLELVISDDNGLTGVALRRHRGEHNLLGKGGCRRLAKLVPSHAIDNGTAAELKFTFVEWLVAPILMPDEAVQNEFLYGYVMGYERMGVALDRALSKIKDDQPRHAGVLRAQLRRLAESDFAKGGAGTEAYVVGVPDLYEVASAFPTGNGVDGLYDWIGLWTFKDLVGEYGGAPPDSPTMAVYGDLVLVLGERFDPVAALAVDGCFDQLAKYITSSLDEDESQAYAGLDAADVTIELLGVLRRALPVPDEIAEYTPTRTGARLALRRLLKASSTGQAILVTPANVSCVIQHHEVAKLVVGVNVGGLVALNLVIELLRLAIGSAVTTVALGQLTSGMAALEDLLPSLRSDRISGLPPHDRLAYVSQELLLWRQSERTSARGSGGSSGGAAASSGEDAATGGSVGYGAIYQPALRRLLSSDAYNEAADAVTAALDDNQHGEAITIIFSAGLLPLIHALIGFRRSLPGHALVDRISEELRPLGPQWVADVLAKALLPDLTGDLVRKRPTALPFVWGCICKFRLDKIPWEDICYSIIAGGNGRNVPPKIPEAVRFTSVTRLREIEPAMLSLLEKLGKVRGQPRSLDTFLAKIYKYESNAKAVAQTDKGAVISSALSAVLEETSTAGATLMLSDDPTREPTVHMVQPGSGGEAALNEAIKELPQTSSMVTALLNAISPAQAGQLGLATHTLSLLRACNRGHYMT